MKILIFSDEYPPAGGGAGMVAKQLEDELIKDKHEVDLLTGKNKSDPCNEKNRTCVTPFTLIWPFLYGLKLLTLPLKKYDLIVLNDYVSAYIAGLFFSKKLLHRCVILIHGHDGKFFFQDTSLKHKVFQYRLFYSRAIKHALKIVASSQYAQNLFVETAAKPWLKEKTSYCYMGVLKDSLGDEKSLSRSDIGVKDENILLFTASRLIKEKGILTQLELFMDLIKENKNYVWLIAGSGPLSAEIQKVIDENNLSDNIKLLGSLPRNKLASYYKLADIFWLLSTRKGETFGLVYIEAACFGTPGIGLRMAGVEEAIKEGVSGYFLDDKSELEFLINKCRELSAQDCINHSKQFDSKKFATYIAGLGSQNEY